MDPNQTCFPAKWVQPLDGFIVRHEHGVDPQHAEQVAPPSNGATASYWLARAAVAEVIGDPQWANTGVADERD